MITYIYIDGFKSFQQFEMTFAPLTVIAGTNASGKSNLFDALKLLSDLASTDTTIEKALKNGRGEAAEAFTLYSDGTMADTITLKVEMLLDKEVEDPWDGTVTDLKKRRLRYELRLRRKDEEHDGAIEIVHESLEPIMDKDDLWPKIFRIGESTWQKLRGVTVGGSFRKPFIMTTVKNGENIARIEDKEGDKKTLKLATAKGTILSKLNVAEYPHIFAVKQEMRRWHFLHLNPTELRRPSSISSNGILAPTGENLAAVIEKLKREDPYYLNAISRMLGRFLPNYVGVDVKRDEDRKRITLILKDYEGRTYTSGVLSEGTLRILALCVLAVDDSFSGVLCFEEPENGVHPFRLGNMAELMSKFASDFRDQETSLRQAIINTHSPLFVSKIKELDDNFMLTYMSRMVTSIIDVSGARKKVGATRMTPVVEEDNPMYDSEKKNELKMAAMTENDFLYAMHSPNLEEK